VGLFNRESKCRKAEQAKVEKRAHIRAKEGRLAMKLMSANTGLALATAIAVKDQKINGEMDTALTEARKAQREYYDFINDIASEKMAAEF
jgi:hypothetical protein